jgi:hypothetical protein
MSLGLYKITLSNKRIQAQEKKSNNRQWNLSQSQILYQAAFILS